jgi:hypothetical protein
MRGYRRVITLIVQLCGPDAVIIARCVGCDVEFLTAPANRGRKDLRCPFGCRQARKRDQSRQRGRKNYKTQKGKKAKQLQNRKRYLKSPSFQVDDPPSSPSSVQSRWAPELIIYLCWIIGTLLGHSTTQIQVKERLDDLLCRFSSQRSLRDRGG